MRNLGDDGIWISPSFQLQQDDFSYDVSDILAVDPIFASLNDFELMLAAALAVPDPITRGRQLLGALRRYWECRERQQ